MSEFSRIVTVCSTIPKLAQHIQKVCGSSMKIVNIEQPSPMDSTICNSTDFLIADNDFIEALLYLKSFERLKFVQSTWAGVDGLVRKAKEEELCPTLKLARHHHIKFGQIMAEYCVASVINMERNMKLLNQNQAQCLWSKENATGYRSLSELKIGILGMGQMGECIAKIFSDFGCEVVGLVSTPRTPSGQVSRYFITSELTDLLASVDYLINVLPATPTTDKILNRDTLKFCKNVGFVNIGRGNVIEEDDIIYALDNNLFSAAVLDVFNVEPLPKSSQLWTHSNVSITPHVAGVSRAQDVADCFKSNLDKFDNNLDLECLVDWSKSY